MLTRTLHLLLPILIPSWRFFDGIAPSPRIEIRSGPDKDWIELNPRPQSVHLFSMLRRLFYNPEWNRYLYLVSCAERLAEDGRAHASDEIVRHIRLSGVSYPFEFRLVFLSSSETGLLRETVYKSDIYAD